MTEDELNRDYMTNDTPVEAICRKLQDRFGRRGERAAGHLRRWLSGSVEFSQQRAIRSLLNEQHLELLLDSFWRVLPFGTGGRRGPVGFGPNRINEATVALTVQGHCNFLRNSPGLGGDLSVVVANDVRVFRDVAEQYRALERGGNPLLGLSSRSLAILACEIYAGNGIRAHLADPADPEAVLTTPELSFAIRELSAAGGVNMSASHNPPDDNGVKVYDSRGAQFVPPDDDELARAMEDPGEIERLDFAKALDEGLVRPIPADVHRSYVAMYLERYRRHCPRPDAADPQIVYTPLSGCGLTTVGDVLRRIGFSLAIPPDQGPDGMFRAIPFRAPNPEVEEATRPAQRFADEVGSALVLSSDPDGDRIGADVLIGSGKWYHLTGNQIAAIIGFYLMLDRDGPGLSGLVIETGVTTRLLSAIAGDRDGSSVIDDLLVGFKYVAAVLRSLEEEGRFGPVSGRPDDLVLAAEESHGILTVPQIRDKDATSAAIYLAALHLRMAREGRSLLDYLEDILDRFGIYGELGRSIVLRGGKGVQAIEDLMASIRSKPPSGIGNVGVDRIVDHWDTSETTGFGEFLSASDRDSRNVVHWLGDGVNITIRPSGTEPKVKLYVQITSQFFGPRNPLPSASSKLEAATGSAAAVAKDVYRELLARLGHQLSDAALLLPDIIDLEQKLEFDREVLPELRKRWELDSESLESLLQWLRSVLSAMIPGADPLPAVRPAIAVACRDMPDRSGDSRLLREVLDWADSDG
jgi:phosphoglucomutase/phosphomannomutase